VPDYIDTMLVSNIPVPTCTCDVPRARRAPGAFCPGR
jgi:hypothetical protein